MLDYAAKWGTYPKRRKLLLTICYCRLRCIWKAMNDKIFKKIRSSPTKTIDIIKSLAFLWVKNMSNRGDLHLRESHPIALLLACNIWFFFFVFSYFLFYLFFVLFPISSSLLSGLDSFLLLDYDPA